MKKERQAFGRDRSSRGEKPKEFRTRRPAATGVSRRAGDPLAERGFSDQTTGVEQDLVAAGGRPPRDTHMIVKTETFERDPDDGQIKKTGLAHRYYSSSRIVIHHFDPNGGFEFASTTFRVDGYRPWTPSQVRRWKRYRRCAPWFNKVKPSDVRS